MWKLNYIECHNFISFKDAELEMPLNSCTLIYGINNDNSQQKNNGTGKSSIIEAIAFGLTGEPLRAVSSVEELINDYSDTAEVVLELENDYDNTLLTIRRTLNRKSPQAIECHKYDADDKEIEVEKTVQPTVLDYNRFILDEIGLSKEDIYSNFILCKNRYKSFFDASDKAKKSMINRFSGADVVDKSIEELKKDMLPVEEELNKAHDAVLVAESKISVINQQLDEVDSKKAEWESDKQSKIQSLNNQLAVKRQQLREIDDIIQKADSRLDDIDNVIDDVGDLQSETCSFDEKHKRLVTLLDTVKLQGLKDYPAMQVEAKRKISKIKEEIETHTKLIEKSQKTLDHIEQLCKDEQKELNALDSEFFLQTENNNKYLVFLNQELQKISNAVKQERKNADAAQGVVDELDRKIRNLNNLIQSVIECPECHHKFVLDPEIDVEKTKREIENAQSEKDKAIKAVERIKEVIDDYKVCEEVTENKKAETRQKLDKCNKKLSDARSLVQGHYKQIDSENETITRLRKETAKYDVEISAEQGKIDGMMAAMFDDALDIIDNAFDKGEAYLSAQKDKRTSIKSAIESFEKAIDEVNKSTMEDFNKSLVKAKSEVETEHKRAIECLGDIQAEYDRYIVQENYFNEFKSYLANQKVEAISAISNHFLQLLNSDLRVEMIGFKKLKSGKIRDKITVNLLRNGVPCGSYARHSGGERARVNLASILGIQRLINNTAPKGKGLDLLVIDEVLESEDQVGIETTCSALNELKVSSLMVTQNPVIDTENDIITIVKENGFSSII